MTCKMECKCIDCEQIELDKFVFIRTKGLEEVRETETCYHCRKYGKYSNSLRHLKNSNIMDNMVYITDVDGK